MASGSSFLLGTEGLAELSRQWVKEGGVYEGDTPAGIAGHGRLDAFTPAYPTRPLADSPQRTAQKQMVLSNFIFQHRMV